MAVPKWKRKESNVEFLSNFHKMRKNTIFILMRDFGIKQKHYTIDLIGQIYELNEEDKKELTDLMSKYGISEADVDKYPQWLIDTWRNEIMGILNRLGMEIELGNAIYISQENVSYEQDYEERRKHFSLAIGYCNCLKDKLQEILSCIKVSTGAYEEVATQLKKEIKLLKGVRRSDSKILKNIQLRLQTKNLADEVVDLISE